MTPIEQKRKEFEDEIIFYKRNNLEEEMIVSKEKLESFNLGVEMGTKECLEKINEWLKKYFYEYCGEWTDGESYVTTMVMELKQILGDKNVK